MGRVFVCTDVSDEEVRIAVCGSYLWLHLVLLCIAALLCCLELSLRLRLCTCETLMSKHVCMHTNN